MTRIHSLAAALLVWVAGAATLLAQANPLEVIPDTALGFAVIQDLADTNEKVTKLSQTMQLPMPDLLTMARGYLGLQQGLDEKGGMAVALVGGEADRAWEDSAFFVVVPTTDYGQLIAPLQPDDPEAEITSVRVAGMEMLVAKKDKFAVFAFGQQSEALKKFLAASKNITASVAPLADWMSNKQLAVVLTPAGKSVLFQTIAKALPDVAQLQKGAGIGGQDKQAEAFQTVGEMFGLFRELLVVADAELTHVAVGLEIGEKASLRLAVRALFVPDGKLAAWATDIKPPAEGLLSGLPGGRFAVAYGGVSAHFSPEMQALLGRITDMGMQMIGLDDEGRKKYNEILQQTQAAKRFTGGVMGVMRPGDSLFSTALAVEHVDNADEHVKRMRQLFELMETAQLKREKGEPLYELNNVKVGDLEAIELVTRLEGLAALQGANNPGGAQMQDMFNKLFGGDGTMRMYVAKADDRTVVTAYSKEQLVHGVEQVRSGDSPLAADADVVATTALLPEGAQWVAYVSPEGLVQWISVFVAAIAGGEVRLPPFAHTEPIGLAAKVSPAGLAAEVVLTDNVVAGIGKYIGQIGQMFQPGGGAPLP